MAQWFELPELPIRLTDRGIWLHGDTPLHPRVAELFARHIVPSPDGTYRLQIGAQSQPIEVQDTAFFVRSLQLIENDVIGLQAVRLWLSDGREEDLDPASFMQSSQHVLYCRVVRHGLRVPCRLMSSHYHTLVWHAEMDETMAYLVMQGRRWPIASYDPRPL